MKTILVPTDFSECAEHALKHACILARKTKAKIILLNVIFYEKNISLFANDGEWTGSWAGEISSAEAPLMIKLLKDTKKKMSHALLAIIINARLIVHIFMIFLFAGQEK